MNLNKEGKTGGFYHHVVVAAAAVAAEVAEVAEDVEGKEGVEGVDGSSAVGTVTVTKPKKGKAALLLKRDRVCVTK